MKKLFLIAILASAVNFLWSQTQIQVINHEVSVIGTSTMHDWIMTTTAADITLTKNDQITDSYMLKDVRVEIPVISLTSEKGKKMEKNTYKALKSDAHPKIIFRSTENSALESSDSWILKSDGELQVAGVTKKLHLDTEWTKISDDMAELTGSVKLLMSDYGVEPPQFLMGAFKTGDEVTIDFKVTIKDDHILQ